MSKNKKKTSSLLVGAAVAGLFLGMTPLASCGGDQASAQHKNGCNGPNGCNGKNSCKGENGCKGTDAKDKNNCNGHNGCNGAEGKKKETKG